MSKGSSKGGKGPGKSWPKGKGKGKGGFRRWKGKGKGFRPFSKGYGKFGQYGKGKNKGKSYYDYTFATKKENDLYGSPLRQHRLLRHAREGIALTPERPTTSERQEAVPPLPKKKVEPSSESPFKVFGNVKKDYLHKHDTKEKEDKSE